MFINPVVTNRKNAFNVIKESKEIIGQISKEEREKLMNVPMMNHPIEDMKNKIVFNLDYIIKNKPKVKKVREYFRTKCANIKDEDLLMFEK